MSQSKNYCRAIDILHDNKTDWKHIVMCLAKCNPKLLCSIVDGSEEAKSIDSTTLKIYYNEGLVPAIKHYKALTGSDLRNSKLAVEELVAKA